MSISVVIPCYNAAETIGTQLEALRRQECREPWEVIVSDNGSTDNSLAIVEQFKGELTSLRIIDASGRRGAAFARNRGAAVASGDAIAFVDADDEVAPGWLKAISEALNAHHFVASRMEFEKLNIPSVVAQMRNHPQTRGLQKLWYPPHLTHAGSSGLAVKRSLFEAVGGYDESFLRVMDADFCVRIQNFGGRLQFVPDAVVHVRCRSTDGASFRQVYLWGEYNSLMYKRHRPTGSELWRWKSHLRNWVKILRGVSQMASQQNRSEFIKRFGWQLGILKGSIKHMVPPIPPP